jgi:hypothetical protein
MAQIDFKAQPSSIEKKIADRLKPSNEMSTASTHSQTGNGPNRVHHTVHRSGSVAKHGSDKKGE